MAIFTRKFLDEAYKSKYAAYLEEDDDDEDEDNEEDEDDDEEDEKSSSNKDKKSDDKSPTKKKVEDKSTPDKIHHLSKSEIRRIMTVITGIIDDFPKLKKCCDYADLSYRDHINNDGERESPFGQYYASPATAFIELIDGDVFSGYPDFRSGGNTEYEKDEKAFVKAVNDQLSKKGIKAKFSVGSDKDDEAISFGARRIKE